VLIVGCAIEMVLIDMVIRRLRPALPQ
jgi:hypothetical protein